VREEAAQHDRKGPGKQAAGEIEDGEIAEVAGLQAVAQIERAHRSSQHLESPERRADEHGGVGRVRSP